MALANETAVGGTHYKGQRLEHWDYTVRALNNRYLEGNITKYVLRHRSKNGLQDLEKAQHYLTKLQEEFAAGRVDPHVTDHTFDVHAFCEEQGLTRDESFVLQRLAYWGHTWHLEQVALTIRELQGIARAKEQREQALKIGAAEPGRNYVNQGDEE